MEKAGLAMPRLMTHRGEGLAEEKSGRKGIQGSDWCKLVLKVELLCTVSPFSIVRWSQLVRE